MINEHLKYGAVASMQSTQGSNAVANSVQTMLAQRSNTLGGPARIATHTQLNGAGIN
jgi:hypothetical protein